MDRISKVRKRLGKIGGRQKEMHQTDEVSQKRVPLCGKWVDPTIFGQADLGTPSLLSFLRREFKQNS